jgi:hypothetical protein
VGLGLLRAIRELLACGLRSFAHLIVLASAESKCRVKYIGRKPDSAFADHLATELELELTQAHTAQKPLRRDDLVTQN